MMKRLSFTRFKIVCIFFILSLCACTKGNIEKNNIVNEDISVLTEVNETEYVFFSSTGSYYTVYPLRYINDGTAIDECNLRYDYSGESLFALLDYSDDEGRLVIKYFGHGILQNIGYSTTVFIGVSGLQAKYFDCWCLYDPSETVKKS